jgi:hypothetical protein
VKIFLERERGIFLARWIDDDNIVLRASLRAFCNTTRVLLSATIIIITTTTATSSSSSNSPQGEFDAQGNTAGMMDVRFLVEYAIPGVVQVREELFRVRIWFR